MNLEKIEQRKSTGLKDKNGIEIFEGDFLVYECRVRGNGRLKTLYQNFVYEVRCGLYENGTNEEKGNGFYIHSESTDIPAVNLDKSYSIIGNIFNNIDYRNYHKYTVRQGENQDFVCFQ